MSIASRFDLAIFDWAGTVIDFGCCAPVAALMQAFQRRGVVLDEALARRDMGKNKVDHVGALLADVGIAAAWTRANGAPPVEKDCHSLMDELAPLMREQAALSATLIDGARETTNVLRDMGLRIGSSTGYTREMMAPVLARAWEQGYAPDHLVCSGETPQGRPSPLMIYKACLDLAVWPLSRVIKIDDSEAGVAEGRAAGCLTVGVTLSGNTVGLSLAAVASLSPGERTQRLQAASDRLYAAGADVVVETVATLVPVLERYLSVHTA